MASRHCVLIAPLALFSFCLHAAADTLRISSVPPGAKVEIDGKVQGITPFEKDYPGGYFHRPRTVLSPRLEHPMIARLSLEGYVTKELRMTEGPLNWISLNGRNHGEYWLLKSDHFAVELKPVKLVFTGDITEKTSSGETDLRPELSLAELVRQTKPAVVSLRGLDKSGTGFFITDTGVLATNAHLARGEESLQALLPGGDELEAKVLYVDDDLDIALAKVEGKDVPHLTLADSATIKQGESVIAIGNPGSAMKFSVTKGMVSAIGPFPEAGPGTWIQTDTPINPGNSGGPLLNLHGEVVGINTLKLVKKDITGIGFALSASNLVEVLQKFYPSSVPTAKNLSAPERQPPPAAAETQVLAVGTVRINEPDGADITVDGRLVGQVPATLLLTAGPHLIVVSDHRHADWIRQVTILKESDVTLRPIFQ